MKRTHTVHVESDEDQGGGAVDFDPADPRSVEHAMARMSLLLGGRPVPDLFGGVERTDRAGTRLLRALGRLRPGAVGLVRSLRARIWPRSAGRRGLC